MNSAARWLSSLRCCMKILVYKGGCANQIQHRLNKNIKKISTISSRPTFYINTRPILRDMLKTSIAYISTQTNLSPNNALQNIFSIMAIILTGCGMENSTRIPLWKQIFSFPSAFSKGVFPKCYNLTFFDRQNLKYKYFF